MSYNHNDVIIPEIPEYTGHCCSFSSNSDGKSIGIDRFVGNSLVLIF